MIELACGNPIRTALICVVAVALAACGIAPMEIPVVSVPPPLTIGADAKLEPIVFSKSVVTLRRGSVIGHLPTEYTTLGQGFGICNHRYGPEATINWRAGGRRSAGGMDSELAAEFYQTMKVAGYNTVGDPEVLFRRDAELKKAKYHIGARITDIKSNICDLYSG